jgi:hypothetical protein
MPNDLNESAVLNTEPDNSEWEQQQRENLDAEYEQGVREADAERRYEESLIEASEPGAAQEMADFRAREEAMNQGASLPFQGTQIHDAAKGITGIDSQRTDANSLSQSSTEDIWGEPRNQELTADEKGLLTPDDLDRMPWRSQNAQEKDQAVRANAIVAEQLQQKTNEAIEKTTKNGTPLRFETSTRAAEYQPGTNTVDFTNKTTSSKSELVPGEGLSGSPETAEAVRSRTEEVFGAKIDRDEFDNSDQPLEIADRAAEKRQRGLESATALASHELRTNAQITLADKNDGIYNGTILGVTDSYLLQRSGPASAIAHDKGMFESLPSYGRDATIFYSAGNARVSLQPNKDKGLGIER